MGSLDLGSQAVEPALKPGSYRSVLTSVFMILACAMKGQGG